MKTTLLFPFLLLCARLLALNPDSPAPLYLHLVEVNREWLHHTPDEALLENAAFATDRARIQKHLELVENELRASDISSLSSTQKVNRRHHLDVLNAYGRTGIFPTNHYHAHRQPYFRDNFGVLCAVGFLMWKDGQYEVVNRINRENNYAYITELAGKYPELGAWTQVNGFSVEELAWIQPGYNPISPYLEEWGNGGGLNPGGHINVLAKDEAETRLFVGGNFSEIDGLPANSIVMWDGNTWSTLGQGVLGEVYALVYQKTGITEKLFVAGNFNLPGQPDQLNIAEYDIATQTWKGLQTGDMEGSVYTLCLNGDLYLGGDFQKVNGTSSPYMAVYRDSDQTWNPYAWALAIDGPVRAMAMVDDLMLTGGDFTKVYQSDAGIWKDATNLAYFDYAGNWLTLPHSLPPVRSLAYFKGNVFTGHQITMDANGFPDAFSGINVLKEGLWFDIECFPMGNGAINGFYALDDRIYAYGGFSYYYPPISYGHGGVVFIEDSVQPLGAFEADSTIRGMIDFQNYLYIAGDFQQLFQLYPYPGLARISLQALSTGGSGGILPIHVTSTYSHLIINYPEMEQPVQLTVYDLQGHLLVQQTLPTDIDKWTFDAQSNWTNGLYFWHLQNAAGSRAGKWVVTR